MPDIVQFSWPLLQVQSQICALAEWKMGDTTIKTSKNMHEDHVPAYFL